MAEKLDFSFLRPSSLFTTLEKVIKFWVFFVWNK